MAKTGKKLLFVLLACLFCAAIVAGIPAAFAPRRGTMRSSIRRIRRIFRTRRLSMKTSPRAMSTRSATTRTSSRSTTTGRATARGIGSSTRKGSSSAAATSMPMRERGAPPSSPTINSSIRISSWKWTTSRGLRLSGGLASRSVRRKSNPSSTTARASSCRKAGR